MRSMYTIFTIKAPKFNIFLKKSDCLFSKPRSLPEVSRTDVRNININSTIFVFTK